MRPAAFFDLDKTILAKSSSLAFARPLFDGGVIGRSAVLKSAYAQFMFLTSGADHDQMEKMRAYMQSLIEGWDVEQVRQIVSDTLESVVDPIIYAEAVDLINQHQADGLDVIVISSSGTEVVEPICERLGVDRAVGTQLAIDDGKYTGEILFYAYGEGKAEAMQALASEFAYDLQNSHAYSDSITDLPMLEAVGKPTAVNPDADLRTIAMERDWPIVDFATPELMKSEWDARAERAKRAASGAAAAVALGAAWYAGRRSAR